MPDAKRARDEGVDDSLSPTPSELAQMAPRARRAKSMDWAAGRPVEEEPMLSETSELSETSDGCGRSVIKAHPRQAWRQGELEYLGTIPLSHRVTHHPSDTGAGATVRVTLALGKIPPFEG